MTEVNKGSVNLSTLTDRLNKRYEEEWRLHTMFEQNGNAVAVYERASQRALLTGGPVTGGRGVAVGPNST